MLSGVSAESGLSIHLSTVLTGLHWLYDTPQPDGAVVPLEGLGQDLTSAGGWRFRFIPAGSSGTPSIVVDTSSSRRRLSQIDVDELVGHIDDFGETVRHAHLSGLQGILELDRPAHPSLLSAVARARRSGAIEATGPIRAVSIADLQQQAIDNAANQSALATPWPLWLVVRDPRGLIRPQRTPHGGVRGRASTSPQSLRLRSPGCPAKPSSR